MTKARDLGDNAQNTKPKVVNAKADLIVGTGSDAADRLAVGSNGDTLVADSSTSTGLRWQGLFAAGKNKIINGDFNINQRGFTSTTTSAVYTFDRWRTVYGGGTTTYSSQSFTLGSAPVAGYEAKNFVRIVTASQSATTDYAQYIQNIEDVRTFAGQTVTLSFWAKASTGTPSIAAEAAQNFGTGGSPSSQVNTTFGKTAITSSWARYSLTLAIPSISGKTLGTNNDSFLGIAFWTSAGSAYDARTGSLGIQNVTIDIWGVQVEAGSVATPFTTATGTLAGELSACQRYYYRHTAGASFANFGQGNARTTTNTAAFIPFPVPMRTAPTSLDSGTASNYRVFDGSTATTCTTLAIEGQSDAYVGIVYTTVASGLTATRNYSLDANNTTAAYIGFSAEL